MLTAKSSWLAGSSCRRAFVRTALAAAIAFAVPSIFPGDASAAPTPPPDGTRKYAITRNGSNIGTHVMKFQNTDHGLVISHDVHVLVKVLFVTAYKYETNRTETWDGDHLVAARSHTNDNGTVEDLDVKRADGGLHVHGSAGTLTASADAVMDAPAWNALARRPPQMIQSDTGKLLKISVSPATEEAITVGGRSITCQRVRVTGDFDATLWYGPDGVLVKERMKARDDSMVETTLQ